MSISAKWLRRTDVTDIAEPTSAADGHSAESVRPVTGKAVFRNFSADDFCPTESWRSLAQILAGNGGCFGLYGPRGSGKSWLMRMAIEDAESRDGLGLWFPCPSKYDASDFLSTLSDNLANAVERRLAGDQAVVSVIGRIRNILAAIVVVFLLAALILYGTRSLTAQSKTLDHGRSVFTLTFPAWMWLLVAMAAFLVVIASAIGVLYGIAAKGRLLREATLLRERIRYTENLKLGADLGVSGGKGLAASLSRSRERTLSERPTSVASLVFDFRNLAEHIVSKLKKPLVICIDELDKIEDTAEVRSLLRNIKGIFEVRETHFLVSISEEAATSLQAGILQSGGRNELNSSFYSVVALSPLDPDEADQLLIHRSFGHTLRLARALCLLGGGNRRELIRMADACAGYSRQHRVPLDEYAIIELLSNESFAFLQEMIRHLPQVTSATAEEDIKYRAWMALPRDAFEAPDKFIKLGRSAIREYWEPRWANDEWGSERESWRRLLIRLFVAATALPPVNDNASACLLDEQSAVINLRDILVMAMQDSGVARLMLFARFGSDLSERYRPIPPHATR